VFGTNAPAPFVHFKHFKPRYGAILLTKSAKFVRFSIEGKQAAEKYALFQIIERFDPVPDDTPKTISSSLDKVPH